MIVEDMPKLESPFVRSGRDFLVTPEINPDYQWVFDDPEVKCVEKLDGTNVSIVVEDGQLRGLWNRMNQVAYGTLDTNFYIDGVRESFSRGYFTLRSGQHFGELMGEKIHGNFLKLQGQLWFPFDYLREIATYRSFHKYEKTFTNLSNWFQNDIFSLVHARWNNGARVQPEGVVFHHPDGRMAKLRRDMFDWFKGPRHKELQ